MKPVPELESSSFEYMKEHGTLFYRFKGANEWREVKAIDLLPIIGRMQDNIKHLENVIGIHKNAESKFTALHKETLSLV
jgi:hypothetical protein